MAGNTLVERHMRLRIVGEPDASELEMRCIFDHPSLDTRVLHMIRTLPEHPRSAGGAKAVAAIAKVIPAKLLVGIVNRERVRRATARCHKVAARLSTVHAMTVQDTAELTSNIKGDRAAQARADRLGQR